MLSDKQCPHLTSMINEKGPLMRYGVNVHAMKRSTLKIYMYM